MQTWIIDDTPFDHLAKTVPLSVAVSWPQGQLYIAFVAQDKGAAFLALAELGSGRAAHPSELWLFLRDQGRINKDQFNLLCESTRKSDQTKIPLRCKS